MRTIIGGLEGGILLHLQRSEIREVHHLRKEDEWLVITEGPAAIFATTHPVQRYVEYDPSKGLGGSKNNIFKCKSIVAVHDNTMIFKAGLEHLFTEWGVPFRAI